MGEPAWWDLDGAARWVRATVWCGVGLTFTGLVVAVLALLGVLDTPRAPVSRPGEPLVVKFSRHPASAPVARERPLLVADNAGAEAGLVLGLAAMTAGAMANGVALAGDLLSRHST